MSKYSKCRFSIAIICWWASAIKMSFSYFTPHKHNGGGGRTPSLAFQVLVWNIKANLSTQRTTKILESKKTWEQTMYSTCVAIACLPQRLPRPLKEALRRWRENQTELLKCGPFTSCWQTSQWKSRTNSRLISTFSKWHIECSTQTASCSAHTLISGVLSWESKDHQHHHYHNE